MAHETTSRLQALIDLPLGARYGVEAAAWLAHAAPDGYHRVEDVAAKLSQPKEFLAKVFRRLLHAGLLAARRGPGGGYRLALAPRDIRVIDVLEAAATEPKRARSCILFPHDCGDTPCAAHAAVVRAEAEVLRTLASLTLADLEPAAPASPRTANGAATALQRVLPALLAVVLGAAACRQSDIETYRVPKRAEPAAAAVPEHAHDHDHNHDHEQASPEAAAPASASRAKEAARPPLAWKAPEGWVPKPPEGMRFATFAVPTAKGETDLSVIVLEGEAGGDLANVNRWRGQLGLPPIDDATLNKTSRKVKSPAGSVLFVDLAGSDGQAGMLAAILPKGGQTWFFKLTGPSSATSAAKPALVRFLGSLR